MEWIEDDIKYHPQSFILQLQNTVFYPSSKLFPKDKVFRQISCKNMKLCLFVKIAETF